MIRTYYCQTGVSLIEILVTTMIVSIGLVGLAALQANSLRFNHQAYMRSVASSQAEAMIERMTANPVGMAAGYYDNLSGTGSNPSCTTCNTQQIANRDRFEWNTANASMLPSGQGNVRKAADGVHTITMLWDGNRTGVSGTNCSGDPTVDLTCLKLSIDLSN
jgi:type IV pilus assembly protein PilV